MAMRRPGIFVPLSAYYFDDGDVMEAGEDAEVLFTRMLAYAARQPEYEGFIADQVVSSRLGIAPRTTGTVPGNGTGTDAGTVPGTDAGSRVGKLLDVGLLSREPGGYRIRGWLKWNKSAAEMGKERHRDRVRKSRSDKGVSGKARDSRTTSRTDSRIVSRTTSRTDSHTPDTDTDTDTDKRTPSTSADAAVEGMLTQPVEAAEKTTDDPDWEHFWSIYPRRVDKRTAHRAWKAATKRADPKQIIDGASRYAQQIADAHTRPEYVKHPSTWLNADAWDNPFEKPSAPRDRRSEALDAGLSATLDSARRGEPNPFEVMIAAAKAGELR